MVAQRQAVHDRGREQPPTSSPRIRLSARLPQPQQEQHGSCQVDMQCVRIGARRDPPGHRRQDEGQPGQKPERPAPGRTGGACGQQAAGSSYEQRRKQVGSIGLLPEWLQQHRREPGQERVGGVARRMGDAEHWPDRLELGRVPDPYIGQQGGHVNRQRDHEDDARRQQVAAPGGGRHHPRVTPQYTPQALTAIDAATSPTDIQPTPSRAMPRATRIVANGAKSLLNR